MENAAIINTILVSSAAVIIALLSPAPLKRYAARIGSIFIGLSLLTLLIASTQIPVPPTAQLAAPTPLSSTSTPTAPTIPVETPKPSSPAIEGSRVVRIIDGDTIVVNTSTGEETVRLIGIDAPEKRLSGGGKECFSQEASDALATYAPPGSSVQIVSDPTQDTHDRYGRTLGYVLSPADQNINLRLIAEGFVHEYTYKVPYQLQKDFIAAEAHAEKQELGMWGACN